MTAISMTNTPHGDWIPIVLWPHAWPTAAALRRRVQRAHARGETLPWARKAYGRLLISPTLFFRAIENAPNPTS